MRLRGQRTRKEIEMPSRVEVSAQLAELVCLSKLKVRGCHRVMRCLRDFGLGLAVDHLVKSTVSQYRIFEFASSKPSSSPTLPVGWSAYGCVDSGAKEIRADSQRRREL